MRAVWTPQQDQIIREHYPDAVMPELLRLLPDKCKHAIYRRAAALGIKRSEAFMASPASGKLQPGTTLSVQHRLKPGHTPWNKGKTYPAKGGTIKTLFKPGHRPANTAEIGAYRINKDGKLQQKISDARGSNSKRWRSVHELVWVAAHGAIPAGHICVFKPGMATNKLEEITLDRVECITHAENMRRNSVHNYGPEIAKAIQLTGQITRQIKQQLKQQPPQGAQP